MAFGLLGKDLGPMGLIGTMLNRDKNKGGGKAPATPGLGAGSMLLSRQDQRAPDPVAM